MSLFAISTTLGLYFSAVFDAVVQILGATVGTVETVWDSVLAHYADVFADYGTYFPDISQPLASLWNGTTNVFNAFSVATAPLFGLLDFIVDALENLGWTAPFVSVIRDIPIIALLVSSGVVISVLLMVFGAIISFARMLLSYLPLPG